MSKWLKTTGEVIQLESREYTNPECQHMVEGNMASHKISFKPYIHVFCNDDGGRLQLPINIAYRNYLKEKKIHGQDILGNIILFESEEDLFILDGQINPITKERIFDY